MHSILFMIEEFTLFQHGLAPPALDLKQLVIGLKFKGDTWR